MKREIIAIGLMTVIICASGCQKENQSEGNVIVPVVKSISTATKASLSDDAEQLLFSAPVKSDAGEEYTLEAWISDTECGMPGTKGVPIDNVTKLKDEYGTFKTTAYCKDLSIYSGMKDATATYNNGSWSYDKTYKWPAAEYCPLTFCSYAPADASISSLSLASGPAASFTYTASDKDLLFAMDTHDRGTKGEIEIHFHHALTSVKFTRGDISGCTIRTISLENFYGTGVATYDGSGWTWTPSGTANTTYTHTFNRNVNDVSAATGATDSGGSLDPNSNESLTFMVIPQNLSGNSAKIKITLSDDSEITYDLSGSKDSEINNWSSYAGKTVTFKVNKKVFDVVLVLDASQSMNFGDGDNISFSEKSNFSTSDGKKRFVYQKYAAINLLKELKQQKGVNVSLIWCSGLYNSTYVVVGDNAQPSSWTVNEYDISRYPKTTTYTSLIKHLSDASTTAGELIDYLSNKDFKQAGNDPSCIYLGLQLAYYELVEKSKRSGVKRRVVIFSDGYPNYVSDFNHYNDGGGYNSEWPNIVEQYANYTLTVSSGIKINSNSKNYLHHSAKDIKSLESTQIYSVLTGGEKLSTNTSKGPKQQRMLMDAISSNHPTATAYTEGSETLSTTVESGKYAYTLYGQNLDTFMPELAKIILK